MNRSADMGAAGQRGKWDINGDGRAEETAVAKKRHRIQARATSSKTIVASDHGQRGMVGRDQEWQGVQDAAEERAYPSDLPAQV